MADLVDRHVLVLNRHWLAVHVCTVRRALTLVYQGLAQIVSEDYQTFDFDSWRDFSVGNAGGNVRMIRSPGFQIRIPDVIVLARYQSNPPNTVRFNRRNVFLRDRNQCQYCGCNPGRDELTVDHVIPRSRGGVSSWDNVVAACTHCNTRKGSRLPSECGMLPRNRPRRPAWMSSLRISSDSGERLVWERFVNSESWEMKLGE